MSDDNPIIAVLLSCGWIDIDPGSFETYYHEPDLADGPAARPDRFRFTTTEQKSDFATRFKERPRPTGAVEVMDGQFVGWEEHYTYEGPLSTILATRRKIEL